MVKFANLDELKEQFIGKVFNFLIVLDVLRNDKNKIVFKCRCRCGNIKDIEKSKVISGHNKSCGCNIRSDIDNLNKEYVGKIFKYLTVLEVYSGGNGKGLIFRCQCKCGNITDVAKSNILSGSTVSCGCYKSSEEKAQKYTEWCKDNPDKVKAKNCKLKQYYDDHPEVRKEISDNKKLFYAEHPEELEKIKIRNKEIYSDPNKKKEISDIKRQQYIENHEIRQKISVKNKVHYNKQEIKKELSERTKQYYINNPDKRKEASNRTRQYYSENPDKKLELSNIKKQAAIENRQMYLNLAEYNKTLNNEKRKNTDFNCLIENVHPDYKDKLLNGEIKSTDKILTKCPICNEYSEHILGNIYLFNKAAFKFNRPLMCLKCKNNLSISSYENEIADYIKSFYSGELIKNDRTVLNGKELDIYIPEKRIAIEFNGDYWHSSEFKDQNYHINKFLKCKENRILLVSIFKSEWNSKKEEIKEYLKDLFNNKENKLSFNEDNSLMNNNYPQSNINITCEIIEHYYEFNNYKVYTCGYTKLC